MVSTKLENRNTSRLISIWKFGPFGNLVMLPSETKKPARLLRPRRFFGKTIEPRSSSRAVLSAFSSCEVGSASWEGASTSCEVGSASRGLCTGRLSTFAPLTHDLPAHEIGPVQLLGRRLRRLQLFHLDEAEALRAVRMTVHGDLHVLYRTNLREQVEQVALGAS